MSILNHLCITTSLLVGLKSVQMTMYKKFKRSDSQEEENSLQVANLAAAAVLSYRWTCPINSPLYMLLAVLHLD
jgi:hypothetical protein